jgi:DNA-directed RNA polymerase subunit alpha
MTLSIPQLTSTKEDAATPNIATFKIRPLQTGYGGTIGNSIRRVLLSSIKGAAVTGFKIDGVSNEFSTIDGVLEDVVDITLAIKQLRFSLESEEPVKLILTKKGSGELTCKDAEGSIAGLEIITPDLKICTLTGPKAELTLELQIEPGFGYIQAKAQQNVGSGMIALDSSFSPVVRARYHTEETREGQRTDLDELNITIETNGSVTPQRAFQEACGILMQQYQILAGSAAKEFDVTEVLEETLSNSEPEQKPVVQDTDTDSDSLTKSIDAIGLKARTTKSLQDAGVQSVADLLQYSDSDLLSLSGFGRGALDEVKQSLQDLGF